MWEPFCTARSKSCAGAGEERIMSNDAWLHTLRTEPSPVFKQQLRARLRAEDAPAPVTRREWPRRALVAVAAVVVMSVVVTVPAVRASVAQFISRFRVVHFVAIPVDETRVERLK